MSQSSQNVRNIKGEGGSVYIDDTAAHAGPFDAIQALEATVVNALIGNMDDFAAGMPLPAGAVIFGLFSSITLTSGKVIAYKRV